MRIAGRGGAGACHAAVFALLAVLIYLLVSGGEPDGGGSTVGGEAGVAINGSAQARVVRVVDGDTVEVSIGGDEEDVRYIGIDTPETVKPGEPVQCYGPQASAANHELVDDRAVRLDFDRELRDVYGRLLAYVYVGDRLINEELLAGGYARTLEIKPNTAMAGRFAAVEERAGEAGKGLWGAC
jgi:micrococcal nuclease